MHRLTLSTAVATLIALPALAQEAPNPVPVIPAPEAAAPQATDTNLQTEPPLITPARKSNCAHSKQVMS